MSATTGKTFPFRFLIIAIALLILFLFLVLIGTPSILSSRWGQNQIISYINQKIPGTVELQEINVSWFGNQKINGFILKDPSGKIVASMDSLGTDSPLIDLVRGDFINSQLKIDGLNATIEQNGSGISNFHQALGIENSNSEENNSPLAIQLKDVNAEISMSGPNNPILINIKGLTSYGNNQGSFEANAVASGLASDKIEKISISINNLPIALLDQFIALENPQRRGFLTEALGETLNATLVQTKTQAGMNVTLDVKTAQLTTTLNGKIVGDNFSLESPGKVNFQMQPRFLNQAAGYQSQKTLPLDMTVEKLNFPLSQLPSTKLDLEVKGTLDRVPFDLGLDIDGAHLIVELKGDRLQGRLPIEIGDEIKLSEPGYLQTNLTPERYQALRRYMIGTGQLNDLDLAKTAVVRLDLKELRLPSSRPSELSFNVNVTADQLSFDDTKTDRQIDLDHVSIAINSAMLRKRVDFTMTNRDINLSGYVQNPYDTANLIVRTQGSFKNLPAGALCEIICFESKTRMKVESLLGPLVDGTISMQLNQWNGQIKANIAGSNGRFDLDGTVTNGKLTLNKPFTAEVKPTQELGRSFLQDYIPLLSGLVAGNEMIKLYVADEGFSMPIYNFDFSYMEIGGLSLDLGRVQFTNEGELGKIMSALKARYGQYLDVWFTPIYISASQGAVNISRFDLLAMQRYQFAAWGQVNIPYNRIDMTIGLSGASLSSALGIKIPDTNYMMQFPLKGSIGHASIDKSKVMAKMAALGTSIAGGPQGMVVGAVIGLATGTLNEPAPPSPTTSPFPWSGQAAQEYDNYNDQQNQYSQQTSERDNQRQQNPVKGLKKEAGKLFKNMFR